MPRWITNMLQFIFSLFGRKPHKANNNSVQRDVEELKQNVKNSNLSNLCLAIARTSRISYEKASILLKICAQENIHNISNFVSQICYESNYFSRARENLNYSEAGLLKVFPTRFTTSEARRYARNPEAIANKVYSNRLGNGSEESGDGWKYRGCGPIQLTFKNNYLDLKRAMALEDISMDEFINHISSFSGGLKCACAYWKMRGCNDPKLTIKETTKIVNGGYNGLNKREIIHDKFLSNLKSIEKSNL